MHLWKKWLLSISLFGFALLGHAQQVTLQWWDYYTDFKPYEEALTAAFRRYEAQNPNVKIQRTPISFGDLKSRIIQATATRTLPDLIVVDNPDHQALAAQGAFADITDLVRAANVSARYFAGPFSSTVYKGRNYGLPFVSNATALYYNEDLLRAAGIQRPPQTWAELRDAAKKLTTSGRFGFCFSATGTEEGTFTFLPFLWSTGADIPTIGDANSVRSLQFLADLMNTDRSVPRAAVGWGQGDVYQQFIAQRCAMMINGPWQLPNFERDRVSFKWGVAPWPRDRQGVSILGGENLAIGAGSNVAEAWKFLQWFTQPANLKPVILALGMLPNRSDMANDPDFARTPILRTFIQQVSVAKPRAYGDKYPQISEQIWKMYQSVLTGTAQPQAAANTARAAIQPLLPR